MVIEVLSKDDVNELITQRLLENNVDLLGKIGHAVQSIIDASLDKRLASLRTEIDASLDEKLGLLRTEIKSDVKKELDLNNRKMEETVKSVVKKELKNVHLVLE